MAEPIGPGWLDLLRIVGALALVTSLVLAVHLLQRRGWKGTGARRLQVLDRLTLARGVQLVVVREGERQLLLGVSEKSVSLLTELDEIEVSAGSPAEENSENVVAKKTSRAHPAPFAAWLATRLRARAER